MSALRVEQLHLYTIHYVLRFVLRGSLRRRSYSTPSSLPHSLCPPSLLSPLIVLSANTRTREYKCIYGRILPHLLHFINGFRRVTWEAQREKTMVNVDDSALKCSLEKKRWAPYLRSSSFLCIHLQVKTIYKAFVLGTISRACRLRLISQFIFDSFDIIYR